MGNSKGSKRVAGGLIDLVLLAGIALFVSLSIAAAVHSANLRAEMRIVEREAQALYDAFETYYSRNLAYPPSYLGRAFETDTLDPLRRRGYYRGFITAKLVDSRVDAYDSPDDRGLNQEFWVEMTLAQDPSIRLVVAKSDDAPLAGGRWLEGVYVYRGGDLEQL